MKKHNEFEIKQAFDKIKQAMIDDNPLEPGSYAHSWHCNIAMMCSDAIHAAENDPVSSTSKHIHNISNDAASRFMKLCFGVETKG